jgi:hypothetical protein
VQGVCCEGTRLCGRTGSVFAFREPGRSANANHPRHQRGWFEPLVVEKDQAFMSTWPLPHLPPDSGAGRGALVSLVAGFGAALGCWVWMWDDEFPTLLMCDTVRTSGFTVGESSGSPGLAHQSGEVIGEGARHHHGIGGFPRWRARHRRHGRADIETLMRAAMGSSDGPACALGWIKLARHAASRSYRPQERPRAHDSVG